jgi:hypothetical protein
MLPSTLNRMTAKPPSQFENLRIQQKENMETSKYNRKKIREPQNITERK